MDGVLEILTHFRSSLTTDLEHHGTLPSFQFYYLKFYIQNSLKYRTILIFSNPIDFRKLIEDSNESF